MRKLKIPKQMEWVLPLCPNGATVVPNETGWPFPVSVKPNGETIVHVPATQAPTNPLGDIPEALF